jgi:PAS domain S-box-containing protein
MEDRETKVREILENSPMGVAVVSHSFDGTRLTGERLFVNGALVQMFGAASREHLLKADIANSWVNLDQLRDVEEIMKKREDLVDFEALRRRFDGTEWWVSMNTRPIRLDNRDCSMVWHFDITKRKHTEEKLRKSEIDLKASYDVLEKRVEERTAHLDMEITERKMAERALSESEELHRAFAANVAHELRTPLSALLFKLGELDGITNIGPLKDDVISMSRLVEQLLSLARLDRLVIQENDVVDLSQVSRKVATNLGHIAINGGHSLEVLGADNPVLVRGNADALEQAVRNLVENAIKYSPRGGLITTEVDELGTIKVIDRGQGIPKEIRNIIFERFERADRRGDGCGIGLSIVQRTIDAHGGIIEVSDTPGGGATFTISISNTIH